MLPVYKSIYSKSGMTLWSLCYVLFTITCTAQVIYTQIVAHLWPRSKVLPGQYCPVVQLTTTGTPPSGQTQTPHLYVLLLTDDIRCVWATSQSNHPYQGYMDNALVWLLLRALGLRPRALSSNHTRALHYIPYSPGEGGLTIAQ